jgi:hypothetical protein
VRMTVNGKDAAFILRSMLKNGFPRRRMIHAHFAYYTPSGAKEKSFARPLFEGD